MRVYTARQLAEGDSSRESLLMDSWPPLGKLARGECYRVSSALEQMQDAERLMVYAAQMERAAGRKSGSYAYQDHNSAARDRGDRIHASIAQEFRRQLGYGAWVGAALPVARNGDRYALDAFGAWAERNKPNPLAVERTVYSVRHRYAGTLDLAATIDGADHVIDWKTGRGRSQLSHRLQAVAYLEAARELGLVSGDARAVVVYLPRDKEAWERLTRRRSGLPYLESAVKAERQGALFGAFLAYLEAVQKKGIATARGCA